MLIRFQAVYENYNLVLFLLIKIGCHVQLGT